MPDAHHTSPPTTRDTTTADIKAADTSPANNTTAKTATTNPQPHAVNNRWIRFIDYFVPFNTLDNEDSLFKHRVLISISFVLQLLLILVASVNAFILDLKGFLTSVAFVLPLFTLYSAIPWLVLRWQWFHASINLSLIGLTLALAIGVYVTGGPLQSSANFLLFMPPMFAICLGGFRLGLIWGTVSYAFFMGYSIADINGYEFPFITPEEDIKLNSLVNLNAGFFAVLVIMAIYEFNNKHLNHELKRQKEQFRFLASHDALTGTQNRYAFYQHLSRTRERANRHEERFALLNLDVNGFKPINDTYGHGVGDQVLILISQRIERAIRSSDIVFRLGGDEFTVILERLEHDNDLADVTHRIRNNLSQPLADNITSLPRDIVIDASIGWAIYPDDGKELEALEKIADQRMYRQKNASREKNQANLG